MAGQAFSVLNNLPSMKAQKDLYFTNIGLNKTLARLSSGRRIVDASDDAAGLAIASGLNANALALDQAVRNANDGIAIIQIADGTLSKMTDLLMRAVTLSEQAASDTVGDNEKEILNIEFRGLIKELDSLVSVTNFNGELLFNSTETVTINVNVSDLYFQSFVAVAMGGDSGTGSVSFGLTDGDCINDGNCNGPGMTANIDSQAGAITALGLLQTAITSISRMRGVLGAQQNRLINVVGNLQTQGMNIRAAESAITDANMAEEVVNMTKYQILIQSGMSSLAQANASSQMVLQLLR